MSFQFIVSYTADVFHPRFKILRHGLAHQNCGKIHHYISKTTSKIYAERCRILEAVSMLFFHAEIFIGKKQTPEHTLRLGFCYEIQSVLQCENPAKEHLSHWLP